LNPFELPPKISLSTVSPTMYKSRSTFSAAMI
jgi:hypothetical protein